MNWIGCGNGEPSLDGFVVLESYRFLSQGVHFDQWFRVTIYYNPTTHNFLKKLNEDWSSGNPPTRWRYASI